MHRLCHQVAYPNARLSFKLTVGLPALPLNLPTLPYAVGKNLQAATSFSGSSPVNLTITSSDPSKVLVSRDPKAVGTAALSFSVGSGPAMSFYVQSFADSGSATLTFSAPGFAPTQTKVNLYPSGFAFNQTLAITTKTAPVNFIVSVIPVLPPGVFNNNGPLTLSQGTGQLSVLIIATPSGTGTLNPATLIFNPGDAHAMAAFTPSATGNPILTITQPAGFINPATNSQLVITVN